MVRCLVGRLAILAGLLAVLGGPLLQPPQAHAISAQPVAAHPLPFFAPLTPPHDGDDDDDDGCSWLVTPCVITPPGCPPTVVKVKLKKVVVTKVIKVPIVVTKIVKVFVPVPVAPTATPPTTTRVIVKVVVPPRPTATPTPLVLRDPGDPMF